MEHCESVDAEIESGFCVEGRGVSCCYELDCGLYVWSYRYIHIKAHCTH